MGEASDPFWLAAADHIAASKIAAAKVFAPSGFPAVLPGCSTPPDAPDFADLDAVILHKGRLEQVPPEILAPALDALTTVFANEVFMVLARGGDPVPADNPHAMTRTALLTEALRASRRQPATPMLAQRPARMAATYVGQRRVLLETAFGHLMLVDGADTAIAPHLIRDGVFDRNLTALIGGLLMPGMTFIDIGANLGTYTLIAAQAVGEQGRVIAMEPSPAIAALLLENVTLNGLAARCEVLGLAVGDHDGTAILHEFAMRQGSNTLLPHVADAARAEYREAITARTVPLRTLDGIVAERAPDRIDCIKIDVEGFEPQVLTGASAALARFRPQLIVEWHSAFFAGRAGAARALHDLLTGALGYTLHRIELHGATRAVTLDDLMALGHSDLLARPAR